MMNKSPYFLTPRYLDHFIEVYGNRYKRWHFLAMRFKRAVIVYHCNSLNSVPIEPPNNSVVVIRGTCPPIRLSLNQNVLLFTEEIRSGSIPVTNDRVDTLLRQLFPRDKILYSYFKSDILFLVTSSNPLLSITIKSRRDQVFKALCNFYEAHQKNKTLTLTEVSQLRFFKRYDGNLKQFNRWSSFAFELCYNPCYFITYANPSAYLGKEIFHIQKRSEISPGPLPPSEFYLCEILLTDTEPVGVAYAAGTKREMELEYVSPMVVAKPRNSFRDTGSVICNAWLPLYQNKEKWETYGLKYYVYGLYQKKAHLKLILFWLQVQTSEKYKFLYMDLVQVAKILFGEESKYYLKPT